MNMLLRQWLKGDFNIVIPGQDETEYLMESQKNAKRLRESDEQFKNGEVIETTLDELMDSE